MSELIDMKKYAADAAKHITIDISRFGRTDELKMIDAVIARYLLDKLLLNESELESKWAQVQIRDYETFKLLFIGNHQESIKWLEENHQKSNFEFYLKFLSFPDNSKYNWDLYFKKIENRDNIFIDLIGF